MLPKGMEWIVILVIALLIFGPKNLPKLGKSLGSTVKNIREGMSSDEKPAETVDEEEDDEVAELEAKLAEAKAKRQQDEAPIQEH